MKSILILLLKKNQNFFKENYPKDFNFNERIENHIQIDSTKKTGIRTTRSFYSSYILIENSIFEKGFTFGNSLSYGSGGGIFAQASSIFISQTQFIHNIAIIGGGLSLNNGELVIEGSDYFNESKINNNFGAYFFNNSAIEIAGSLYYAHSGIISTISNIGDDPLTLKNFKDQGIIRFTSFINSTSKKHSGAAIFISINDLYLNNIKAFNNSALISGGVFSFFNSNVSIKDSIFQSNYCNGKYLNNNNEKIIKNGGGSIYFQTIILNEDINNFQFITENCCFGNNKCTCSKRTSGQDILFSGKCFWKSLNDLFQKSERESIGKIQQLGKNQLFKSFINTEFSSKKNKCWNINESIDCNLDYYFDDDIENLLE